MKKLAFVMVVMIVLGAWAIAEAESKFGNEAYLWWEDYIVYYSVRAVDFDIEIRRQPFIKEYDEVSEIRFDQCYLYVDNGNREIYAAVIPIQDADGSNKRALCAIAAMEYTFEVDNAYDLTLTGSPRLLARDFLAGLIKSKDQTGKYYRYMILEDNKIYAFKTGYVEEISKVLDKMR